MYRVAKVERVEGEEGKRTESKAKREVSSQICNLCAV